MLPRHYLLPVAVISLAAAATSASMAQMSTGLTLDPRGAVTARLGYFPVPIALSETRPKQITKEPVYAGKPKYGIIRLGNGPKSDYVVALDEPASGDAKIYIDRNRNGDLTDDGDGTWNAKTSKGRVMYGVMNVTLRASYGDAKHETGGSEYTIGVYRFPENPNLFIYRQTARKGRLVVDGKGHEVLLVENDADALYTKSAKRPLWLGVDLADNGRFTIVNIAKPFKLGAKNYEASVSEDGYSLALHPTTKEVVAEKAPAAPPPPLKAGTAAPDFVAEKWGGGDLNLAAYKGKVVILDFWATWCGPCQQSMPHIEKVWQETKSQNVVVLGVCVWDSKDAYKTWVPENQSKYTFQLAFDPAGRDNTKSIASKMFGVSGIPTTFVIDKDGKVADAIVGYDEGDTRVEEALKKLGVHF